MYTERLQQGLECMSQLILHCQRQTTKTDSFELSWKGSLATRNELAKLEHDTVQYVHLLPPSFLLPASEVAEGVHLLFIGLAVPPLHFTSLRIHHCQRHTKVDPQPLLLLYDYFGQICREARKDN